MEAKILYHYSIVKLADNKWAVLYTSGDTEGSLSRWEIHTTYRHEHNAVLACQKLSKEKR